MTPPTLSSISPEAKRQKTVGICFSLNLLIVFCVCTLNHTAAWWANRGDYTPFSVGHSVSPLVYDETEYYAPGPRKFSLAGTLLCEMDLYEYRHVYSHRFAPFHSAVIGILARGIGSLELAWMILHGLMPALVWAMVYRISREFTTEKSLAALTAWLVILVPFAPRNFLLVSHYSLIQPLEITRLPHPGLSFAFVLGVMLMGCSTGNRTRTTFWLAAAATGCLLYLYYFYYVAVYSALGILFLQAIAAKQPKMAKRVIGIIIVGLCLGLPCLALAAKGLLGAGHDDSKLLMRVSAHSRAPDSIGLCLMIFGALGGAYWLRRNAHPTRKEEDLSRSTWLIAFLFAMLFGAGLGMNLQLITGINAQHSHFMNRVAQPLGTMLLCISVLLLLRRTFANQRAITMIVCGTVLAALISVAAWRQISTGLRTSSDHLSSTSTMDVLNWVRGHSSDNDVVGSSDQELIELIPAISGRWNFVPAGGRTVAQEIEILERYVTITKLEGGNLDEAVAKVRGEKLRTPLSVSPSWTLFVKDTPDASSLELVKKIWRETDIRSSLRRWRLNMLLLQTGTAPSVVSESASKFSPLYSNRTWTVWQVSSKTLTGTGL